MQLIAFVGFKASGKNTAATPLIEHGYEAIAFADSMKDALAAIFCWDRNMLEGITEHSRLWREEVDEWWAKRLNNPRFSPRWAMQNFGTQIMRNHFHQEIWTLNVERRIAAFNNHPVVVTDTRFPNEISLVRRLGGHIVRIKRGPDPDWMELAAIANQGNLMAKEALARLGVHESEYAWIGSPIDVTLTNDGEIADLHRAVRAWAGA